MPSCSEQIVLRLPRVLRDKIEIAAACEGRSLAKMVAVTLRYGGGVIAYGAGELNGLE
jgi:hypothetical protein